MKSFGDVKGSRDRKKLPRIEEVIQTIDWSKTKGKYVKLRLMPPDTHPFTAIAQQWVTKTIDGEKGIKEVRFPRLVYGYQPLEDAFAEGTEGVDPYIKAGVGEMARSFYVNCIVRALEKERQVKPTKKELKTGFKDPDSDSTTPMRGCRFPFSVIKEIAKLEQLNEHEVKIKAKGGKVKRVTKCFPVSHPVYGRDIMIANDPSQPPAKQYSVQMGDVSPLTEKQLAYLSWDMVGLAKMFTNTETLEQIQAEFDNDFPPDEPKAKGKGAGKDKTYFDKDSKDGKSKKKVRKEDSFDLDDDKPKKKLKSGKKLKKKSSSRDEDAPKKKLKSGKKLKKKSSDEALFKGGKKIKKKSGDEKSSKLKKSSGKKVVKKGKKKKDDDFPF